MAMIL